VVIIKDYSKIDVIRILDSIVLHQQIEKRNGLTFMRMKKRPYLSIK